MGQIDDDFCHGCGAPRSSAAPGGAEAAGPEMGSGRRLPPATTRRSPLWPWVAAAVIVVLAIAAAGTFLLLRGRDQSASPVTAQAVAAPAESSSPTSGASSSPTPAAQGSSAPAATGAPLEVNLTSYATASASSHLASSGGNTYAAANLLDGDRATCWAEGSPGYGLGEQVRFEFSTPVALTEMRVMPGYMKRLGGWDRWWANGRLERIELTFSDGSSQTFRFADREGWQAIRLDKVQTNWVEMTVVSAYPARPGPHAARDLCVSEAEFSGWSLSSPSD